MIDKFLKSLKSVDDLLEKVEKTVLIGVLSLVIGLSFLQVILRNFFGGGFIWGDVFLRHMVLWLGLIGASIATKENRHINIDIVSRILKDKSKSIINILINLVSAYICWLLLKASISFVSAEKEFGSTIFADTPVWIFQSIFPVAFSIMVFRFVLNVFNNFKSLIK